MSKREPQVPLSLARGLREAFPRDPADLKTSSSVECEWCADTGCLTTFRDLASGTDYPVKAFDVPEFRWTHEDFLEVGLECVCAIDKRRLARAESQIRAIFGDMGERAVYRNFTFESWDGLPLEFRCGKEEARRYAGEFARTGAIEVGGVKQIGLVLSGPTGTTKTGLATYILKERIAMGQTCPWIECWRLIEQIKATYNKSSKRTYLQVIDSLVGVPLLLLDDVGPGRGVAFNDHTRNLLWSVLDQRYARLLPTLMTVNLDWEQFMDAVGAALAYRINQVYRWQVVGGRNLRAEE